MGKPMSVSTQSAESVSVGEFWTTWVRSPFPEDFEAPFRLKFPLTVGVAHRIFVGSLGLRTLLAGGVGHDERAESKVWSRNVHRSKAPGFRPIANGHEVMLHSGQPEGFSRGDVLDDDKLRRDFPDDAEELGPESGAMGSHPCTLSCAADILTRKSSANKVNGSKS
jgi:hypothetical protein